MKAGLKENVAALPPIDGIKRIRIPQANHVLENKEGKKASISIYNHLRSTYGKLDRIAAERGLELYGEYTKEAKEKPGSHPNIDLLLRVAKQDLIWDIVIERS